MERLELRQKFIETLQNVKKSGFKILDVSERSFGENNGKNSVRLRLAIDSCGKPLSVFVDYIWGKSCEDCINILHHLEYFNPEILAKEKDQLLEGFWQETHPDSRFKLRVSETGNIAVLGTTFNIGNIDPDDLPGILEENIISLVKEIPHAEIFTKRFTQIEKRHTQKNPVTE